ncbi:MAG: hypothetical protein QM796_17415 [Chthoniobacteraceae bacterium]
MNQWKSILAVCAIFILGLVCGSLLTVRVIDHKLQTVVRSGPEGVRALVLQRLTRQLHLTPDQREKVQAITEKTMAELQASRRKIAPEINQTMEMALSEIRTILNPEQIRKLDELADRRRMFWQAPDRESRPMATPRATP